LVDRLLLLGLSRRSLHVGVVFGVAAGRTSRHVLASEVTEAVGLEKVTVKALSNFRSMFSLVLLRAKDKLKISFHSLI
jgi:hypothetical protein